MVIKKDDPFLIQKSSFRLCSVALLTVSTFRGTDQFAAFITLPVYVLKLSMMIIALFSSDSTDQLFGKIKSAISMHVPTCCPVSDSPCPISRLSMIKKSSQFLGSLGLFLFNILS